MMTKKAVVLLSGGLDSATCLALAIEQGYQCYALSFDYDQKQAAELNAAKKITKQLGAVQHQILKLGIGELKGSALTDANIDVPDYQESGGIPITYVPARNTTFLSIALGWAEILNAQDVFVGICSTDHAGYPDTRPEYLASWQTLAQLATKTGIEEKPIQFKAPLMYLNKAETILQGIRLGVDYSVTVSCYQANQTGLACGRCDACVLRKRGFAEASIADPTRYYEDRPEIIA